MTEEKKDAASESVEEASLRLTAERDALAAQQEAVIIQLRQLRESEDPATGTYFAQEIFALSQEKLRLAAEIDIRERHIRRLSMPDDLHGFMQ